MRSPDRILLGLVVLSLHVRNRCTLARTEDLPSRPNVKKWVKERATTHSEKNARLECLVDTFRNLGQPYDNPRLRLAFPARQGSRCASVLALRGPRDTLQVAGRTTCTRGGTAQPLKKFYRPRAILRIPAPPWLVQNQYFDVE
ncbi:hypothetical protein H4582DRAFT_944004 [Lactarius indigo]|nr:hypothetical protein H4582DRAFT_944004 [Lactarius indigo]